MRPKGRSALESLYFEYPYFDAPADVAENAHLGIVIVGAGPIGMITALTLAKYGVRSTIIDNKSTFNDGSRAICISRSSFQILHSLGVDTEFIENALPWDTGYSYFRGQKILEFRMPDGENEKFRPMYNLQQQYIEQFLWNAVARNPLIDTRWQSELVGLEQTPDLVKISVKDPKRNYTITCDWVIAADGARSTTRRLCGRRLNGTNFEGRYVIADIEMDHDFPTIRRALFHPKSRPDGTVLIHKQPKNIWRIDYQLSPDEDADVATSEMSVRNSVANVLRDIGHTGSWDLEWWSIYSANTLLLDDYRDDRVFFVGDSAHIVPIFGVRGLNNGIADGFNLGWKLAYLINGQADPSLLDTYTPERRGATLDVFANATKSARFMTPPTRGWHLMRDAALSLALGDKTYGQLANPRQMTPYIYADSHLTYLDDPNFTTGPKPGAVFIDGHVGDRFLSETFSDGFTLLYFGQTPPNSDPWMTVVPLNENSALAGLYGAVDGTAYLVRPDLHISGRWKNYSPQSLGDTLKKLGIVQKG